MPSYIITGASRGIGFQFLSDISADPSNTVVGLVRNKAATEQKVKTELGSRPNVHIVQADLADYDSLKKSVDEVSPLVNGAVDYLIANAGYISTWSAYDTLGDMGKEPKALEDELLKHFQVNVVGNVHLINLYMPLVLKGQVKKVIVLSTGYADDKLTTGFGIGEAGPYTISKAALNTVVAKYAAQYADQGVLFLAIAPGAVEVGNDAEMTEETMKKAMALGAKFVRYAPHFRGRSTPAESVRDMLSVINRASIETGYSGEFVSQFGNKQWL